MATEPNMQTEDDLTKFLPQTKKQKHTASSSLEMASFTPSKQSSNSNNSNSSYAGPERTESLVIRTILAGFLLATILTLFTSHVGNTFTTKKYTTTPPPNSSKYSKYNNEEQMQDNDGDYDDYNYHQDMTMMYGGPHGKQGGHHDHPHHGGMMGGGMGMMMNHHDPPHDHDHHHHHHDNGGGGGSMMKYMETIHHLLDSAEDELIARQVHKDETTGTILTRTTSADPQVASWIQEHVWSMLELMEQQQDNDDDNDNDDDDDCHHHHRIRQWDPLFVQLFQHANEIIPTAENINGEGIQVMLKGTTPCGTSLAELHAQAVTTFVRGGWEAAHRPHEASDQCD